uniref:Uncharacterized protein n=1 Tax=Aegilops tauschii TaxID=37682 RepID=M8BY88_AEGTA
MDGCTLGVLHFRNPAKKPGYSTSTAAKQASTEKWVQISVLEDNYQAGSSVHPAYLNKEVPLAKRNHCENAHTVFTTVNST